MPNLTLEDASDLVKDLTINGHHIDCPLCGRAMMTSESPETSAFWSHFFSKKHDAQRPVDPSLEDALRQIIRRTSRAAKAAEREAAAALKQATAQAKVAEYARLRASHRDRCLPRRDRGRDGSADLYDGTLLQPGQRGGRRPRQDRRDPRDLRSAVRGLTDRPERQTERETDRCPRCCPPPMDVRPPTAGAER